MQRCINYLILLNEKNIFELFAALSFSLVAIIPKRFFNNTATHNTTFWELAYSNNFTF